MKICAETRDKIERVGFRSLLGETAAELEICGMRRQRDEFTLDVGNLRGGNLWIGFLDSQYYL